MACARTANGFDLIVMLRAGAAETLPDTGKEFALVTSTLTEPRADIRRAATRIESLAETAKLFLFTITTLTGPRLGIRRAGGRIVTRVLGPKLGAVTACAALVCDELPAGFEAVTLQA